MTKTEQIDFISKLDEDSLAILSSKGNDYANEDVLSNFKNVSLAAKALGIDITKPEQYALFMVVLKIARITNLLNSNKTPSNESVGDSFRDGINYFKLAYCCYEENQL